MSVLFLLLYKYNINEVSTYFFFFLLLLNAINSLGSSFNLLSALKKEENSKRSASDGRNEELSIYIIILYRYTPYTRA